MQIIKSLLKIIFFVLPFPVLSQSTYLNEGAKEYHFIDRLEIKQQRNTSLNFSTTRNFNRRYVLQQAQLIDSARMNFSDTALANRFAAWNKVSLSAVDEYNLQSLYMNNSEWYNGSKEGFKSKLPVLKTFYKTKSNFFEVNSKDFFLAVNPVLHFNIGNESGYGERLFINSRGITIRGMIANRVGFSTSLTDNQERGPLFFQQWVKQNRAVPGVGFYKVFKKDLSAQDYFDARGYFTFNAAKFIDFQFGYDKNFIGNGYRSLFLSDWGNSNLFLKINTRIWKLNYQNLFMELMPQFTKNGDSLLKRKYAAMHHLSMNVTKWLNIGLFEGVMFGRTDHFDFQYLNPIIFYRHIEGSVGSPDNAVAGLDVKANVAKKFQFYGQLMLDEFILSKVKNDPTNWTNKFGFQLGGKYIDAFGVKNLDLQVEMNRVRPFTYSHYDTINNFTHYNQPMVHPLGANFQEWIGIVRYQPFPKWYLYARAIYYYKGLDSANANFGGDIFRSYNSRLTESGYKVGSGNKLTVINTLINISYEFRQNLFFEAGMMLRRAKEAGTGWEENHSMFNLGIRLNMFKRDYNF